MVEILPKTAWNPKQSIKQTIHNKIWRTSANVYYLRYQWLFTQIRRKKINKWCTSNITWTKIALYFVLKLLPWEDSALSFY